MKALRDRIYTPPATPDEFAITFQAKNTTTQPSEDFFGFLTKFKRTGMKQGELLQAEFEVQLTGTHTMVDGV